MTALLLSLSESASGLDLSDSSFIFSILFYLLFFFPLFKQNTEVSTSSNTTFLLAVMVWQHFPEENKLGHHSLTGPMTQGGTQRPEDPGSARLPAASSLQGRQSLSPAYIPS